MVARLGAEGKRVTTSHGRPRRQGIPRLLRVVPEGAAAIAAGLRLRYRALEPGLPLRDAAAEARLSEVKPGDLLFVEGTYFKGRKKQQKGNIVHVEMFLGEELGSGRESTLASRDHWGCVSIQDSFKYVSPWYEITALHWRSLDDWLEGRCDPVALPD